MSRKIYGKNHALEAAVIDFGGQAAVARALHVSQGLIGQYIHGRTKVTAERALTFVRLFEGAVAPELLCPGADWGALELRHGVTKRNGIDHE